MVLKMPDNDYLKELERLEEIWPRMISEGFWSTGKTDFNPQSPSVAIGSGCSLSIAGVAELMLNEMGAMHTRVCTPYEFVHSGLRPGLALLVSAKGEHSDVINCYKELLSRSCPTVVVTSKRNSSLVRLAQANLANTGVFGPMSESRRGGFIPVESSMTMASLLLLIRYASSSVPDEVVDILSLAKQDHENAMKSLSLEHIREVNIVATLFGKPAAQDVETRLQESGLAVSTITDPWNFGHGRYMMVACGESRQLLVMIYTPDEKDASLHVLSCIPKSVSTYVISAPQTGLLGSLYCLYRSMLLVGALGIAKKMDPAKLEVPAWGDSLYEGRPTYS